MILMVYLGKTEANRDLLRETGMLSLLLQQLASPNKVILHNAMAALVNASIGNTANQNVVREAGALQSIVDLMRDEHPKTRQVHTFFLFFKTNLTNPHRKECLLAAQKVGDE